MGFKFNAKLSELESSIITGHYPMINAALNKIIPLSLNKDELNMAVCKFITLLNNCRNSQIDLLLSNWIISCGIPLDELLIPDRSDILSIRIALIKHCLDSEDIGNLRILIRRYPDASEYLVEQLCATVESGSHFPAFVIPFLKSSTVSKSVNRLLLCHSKSSNPTIESILLDYLRSVSKENIVHVARTYCMVFTRSTEFIHILLNLAIENPKLIELIPFLDCSSLHGIPTISTTIALLVWNYSQLCYSMPQF